MKNDLTVLCFILGMSFYTHAQINPHAIGVRFGGDGSSNGAELSYQHRLSAVNRLEFDFGFRGYENYSDLFVSGTYQWDWNIDGGLNWYIGPGAALGFYNWTGYEKSSGINLGIGGQIGLEFNFNKIGAPILLSLDTRPMFGFVGYNNGFGWGAALGVRYTW